MPAPAFAQGSGKVPVAQDLRRLDRIERRLDETGSTAPAPPPARVRDPSGVPGFSGPPGADGDSVNSYGPLPQGISGGDIR